MIWDLGFDSEVSKGRDEVGNRGNKTGHMPMKSSRRLSWSSHSSEYQQKGVPPTPATSVSSVPPLSKGILLGEGSPTEKYVHTMIKQWC